MIERFRSDHYHNPNKREKNEIKRSYIAPIR